MVKRRKKISKKKKNSVLALLKQQLLPKKPKGGGGGRGRSVRGPKGSGGNVSYKQPTIIKEKSDPGNEWKKTLNKYSAYGSAASKIGEKVYDAYQRANPPQPPQPSTYDQAKNLAQEGAWWLKTGRNAFGGF